MQSRGQRWVIKIGSALLTNQGKALNQPGIVSWIKQMSDVRHLGVDIVFVSSGAVAAGVARMGWRQRPSALADIQAAAAIGQMALMQTYDEAFNHQGLRAAQILLTHEDIADRQRYLNARSTLLSLLQLGVVPIINENDSVVTDEIKLGDNDSLAALVANLVDADRLLLLTDQQGLYDQDPSVNPKARLITWAEANDSDLDQFAGTKAACGRFGSGGMMTKVQAARIAARSGASTHIVSGHLDQVLVKLAQGESLGTYLQAEETPMAARKRWIAGQLQSKGVLIVDKGAERALIQQGRSLLPSGIVDCEGFFGEGDLVECKTQDLGLIAKGLCHYCALDVQKIMGQHSDHMASILGFAGPQEVIHRDNLVLV